MTATSTRAFLDPEATLRIPVVEPTPPPAPPPEPEPTGQPSASMSLPATGVLRVRKRPVERRALQFTGDNYGELVFFTGGRFRWSTRDDNPDPQVVAVVWDHLHDTWIGMRVGDWVLEADRGETYPMTNAVFQERCDVLGPDKEI